MFELVGETIYKVWLEGNGPERFFRNKDSARLAVIEEVLIAVEEGEWIRDEIVEAINELMTDNYVEGVGGMCEEVLR